MEEELRKILKEPLTGRELRRKVNIEPFDLWKICMENFIVFSVARHYLRLDRNVKGYLRLSPSILREFMTYSVIGVERKEVLKKADILRKKIKEISRKKFELGKKISLNTLKKTKADACFIIAGDVALEMAHDEPRLERYTNTLVKGSDIDIVVIIGKDRHREPIEEYMLKIKHMFIKDPRIREEIDFKIKKIEDVVKDSEFNTLSKMIACKIICEGKYLAGNLSLYKKAKSIVRNNCKKLEKMEKEALKRREKIIREILKNGIKNREHAVVFYGTEEFYEEF